MQELSRRDSSRVSQYLAIRSTHGNPRVDPGPQMVVPEDVKTLASFFCCDAYIRFSNPDPFDVPVIGGEDNLKSSSKEDID